MSKILFSNEMLENYGCKNCIWKEMDQCPNGYTSNESTDSGYCDKLFNFLTNLAEGEDSISAVKEKFHLFIQETQSLSDRKEYFELKQEYDRLKSDGADRKILIGYEVRMNNAKLCWMRMSDSVIKNLSKVVDRESRVVVDSSGPRLTVQELNSLLKGNLGVSVDPTMKISPKMLDEDKETGHE